MSLSLRHFSTKKTLFQKVILDEDNMVSNSDKSLSTQQSIKAYVDSVASGLDVKESCRVATTDAGNLTSGFVAGSVIDDITLVTSDRILIKNQTDGSENGIYTVNSSGAPTRALNFDENSEVTSGAFTFIEEGTTNSDTGFVLTTDGNITIGSTSLSFTQFSRLAQLIPGDGLSKTADTLNLDLLADSGLEINSNKLSINLKNNGGLQIENSELALDLSDSSISGILSVSNGGTGFNSWTYSDAVLISNTQGTTGAMQQSQNLRFTSNTLQITGDQTMTGNLDIGGNLDVSGTQTTTGNIIMNGNISSTPGDGSKIHIDSSTITDDNTAASGTATKFALVNIEAPTLDSTNSSVTTSDAATLYISGSVKSGTNNTIPSGHKYSLWCARENNESIIRLDGTTYTRKINITDATGISSSTDLTGDTTIRRASGGGRIQINTVEVPLKTDNLGYFNSNSTTSDELRGVISDDTGTGSLVFATSPTLVTPALGTPASGVLTNCTGTASGLTAGKVTVTNSTTDTDFPIVFNDESNGLLDDTGSLIYNPSNGNLTLDRSSADLTIKGGNFKIRNAGGDLNLSISTAGNIITDNKIGTAADEEYIDFSTSNEINTKINDTERLSVTSSGVDITGDLTVSGNFPTVDTTVAGDSGSTAITPGDTLTIAGGTNVTTSMSGDTLTITSTDTNTQLSNEQVHDIVGALIATGGTKTGISISYQDGTDDMDFVVSDTTVAGDSGSTAITPGDTLTIAGGTNVTTSMSGDTLTITSTDTNTTYTSGNGLDLNGTEFSVGVSNGILRNSTGVEINPTQTNISSILNNNLVVGRDTDNQIKFSTDDQMIFRVKGDDNVIFKESGEIEATSLDISGDTAIDGTTTLNTTEYLNSNVMKYSQHYFGNSSGDYFSNGEYQKVLTIIPSDNSQNYHVQCKISVQSAQNFHHVYINAGLRSNTLPNLDWKIYYDEEYNNNRFIDPLLWTKSTTTAGFILAFEALTTIYGMVTCDITVVPRFSGHKSDISINTTSSSEQSSVDSGYTSNDMIKVISKNGSNVNVGDSSGVITAGGFTTTGTWTFDDASSGTVGITTIHTGSSFADNDTSLMTSGAIKDKIESYGFTTNTGDMTGVDLTEGNGISISESNTTSGNYTGTITLNSDETTLSNNVGSGQAGVLKVPNALTAGTNISFSSGTTYDGSSALTMNVDDAFIKNNASDTMSGTLTILKSTSGNNLKQALKLVGNNSNGTGGNNIGVSIEFGWENDDDSTYIPASRIYSIATDAEESNEEGDLYLQTSQSNSLHTYIQLDGSAKETKILNQNGLSVSGDITALTSDKRLKKNIKIIENPLEKINKLSGFTYDWSLDKCEKAGFIPKDERQIGVFAQDVQSVIPEAVKSAPFDTEDGISKSGDNYLTVQYEKIVPLLIESIKEQQNMIEKLQGQIDELKNKII